MITDTFASRLKKAMVMNGITQIQLSERTGIHKSHISKYLKGEYKAKQNNLYLLARCLNVAEAYLMGFDVNPDGTAIVADQDVNDPLIELLKHNIKLLTDDDRNLIRYIVDTRNKEQNK
jgi:transcriptional regulator with XRE-family HTH domain